MDESKKQLLTDIFWEMNEISSSTDTKTETVITETDDGHGNIVETESTVTQTYLYITVSHKTADEMRTELYTVVDQGGVVVDVAVENPLYGELRGNLNLASRYDVDTFITQAANTPECLLSRMTGGVHLHTLRCPDKDTFARIRNALEQQGLLYRKE